MAYAASLSSHHRTQDAQAVLCELGERYRSELLARSWRPALVNVQLGSILAAERRFEEAEKLLVHAHATLALAFERSDRRMAESRVQLVRLYQAWGKPDRARVFQ